jgi:hypothetical protein
VTLDLLLAAARSRVLVWPNWWAIAQTGRLAAARMCCCSFDLVTLKVRRRIPDSGLPVNVLNGCTFVGRVCCVGHLLPFFARNPKVVWIVPRLVRFLDGGFDDGDAFLSVGWSGESNIVNPFKRFCCDLVCVIHTGLSWAIFKMSNAYWLSAFTTLRESVN